MRKFSMTKSKFSKPPVTDAEREKKADEFINLPDSRGDKKIVRIEKTKKEKTKSVFIRAPESLWGDIHEVSIITGVSMNAICLELLRPGIKRKLKELKED